MRRALAALALAVVLPLPGLADVVVKPGETLGEIAERYGVSVNRLMQANGIKDPTLVQIGQRLVIPGRGGSSGSGGGGSRNTGSYTVKSGETLGEIAQRYNTTAERLMQLNGISDPTQLQAGSRIAVPGGPSRQAARPSQPVRNTKAKEHVVQPGESLSEIADAYNLPLQKLVSLNNISDPNLLMSGTRLKLTAPPPVPASRPAPKPPKAAAPKPKPVVKPAAKPAPAVAAKPKPAPSRTAAAPAATASTPVASTPAAAPTATPAANAPTTSTAAKPATAAAPATSATPTAAAAATATPQVAARPAPKPRASATTTAAKPAGPDWRTYGPLQVDWANWQPMGGSFVAPSLNAEGQPLYTAINCGARKLNSTSQTGQWRTWEAPRSDAEQQLVSDLCKAKGS